MYEEETYRFLQLENMRQNKKENRRII